MQTHKHIACPVNDRVFVSAATHALNLQDSDCIFWFLAFDFFDDSCERCRGAQHHWHTAGNEAIANGGKKSGMLDSVPQRSLAWVAWSQLALSKRGSGPFLFSQNEFSNTSVTCQPCAVMYS